MDNVVDLIGGIEELADANLEGWEGVTEEMLTLIDIALHIATIHDLETIRLQQQHNIYKELLKEHK